MLTRDYTIEVTNLDFNEGRDDGVAVASAGPYANHLHLYPDRYPDRYPRQHIITQFGTGRMLFLMPNQQCQSTEGMNDVKILDMELSKRVS